MVDTAEPDGSLVSAEELGRGWDGAADISAGWTGDAGGRLEVKELKLQSCVEMLQRN